MIVLGVDPGSYNTGWGVVERQGAKLTGVAAGVISCGRSDALPQRLRRIYQGLTEVIAEYKPTNAAVEDIFFGKHANSALKLGHARGVVLLATAQADLPLGEYPPAVVKRSIGGNGRTPKDQVAAMVGRILGWQALPSADAMDALAVAITHANSLPPGG